MITLGLDPSLTGFGWCVHDSRVVGPKRVVAKGVFSTPASRVFVWRYQYLREAVGMVLDRFPTIDNVGVESPPFGESFSEGLYGLFLYVNEAVYLRRKDVVYFDPQTVKRLAKMDSRVRRGTMDKSDMIEAAKVDSGVKRWNHNEADAYIVAREAARFWEYIKGQLTEEELTHEEHKAFIHTHTFKRGPKAGLTVRTGLSFKEHDRFFQFSNLEPHEIVVTVDP